MNEKYRPYFTQAQLSELILILREHPTNQIRKDLIQYLEGFNLRINHGLINPNHTAKPSLEQKLGFAPPVIRAPILTAEQCFAKYTANPMLCTLDEIDRAQLYRYEHDLMSTIEEQEYEKSTATQIDNCEGIKS